MSLGRRRDPEMTGKLRITVHLTDAGSAMAHASGANRFSWSIERTKAFKNR
jgi:hypothetical protein